jgi:hypothetical protein
MTRFQVSKISGPGCGTRKSDGSSRGGYSRSQEMRGLSFQGHGDKEVPIYRQMTRIFQVSRISGPGFGTIRKATATEDKISDLKK